MTIGYKLNILVQIGLDMNKYFVNLNKIVGSKFCYG